MPLSVNIDDAMFYANIKAACARDLPWLTAAPAHDGHAVLVGAGPSLTDTLRELRWRHEHGQTIFALNNTARWLLERGITPDYHVILDGRPSNARFVVERPALHCLLASQCAPETIDTALARGHAVTIWHPNVPGIGAFTERKDTVLVSGGTTVGLLSMDIARIRGFQCLHLHGFDSSYRRGDGHAYAQPENARDETIEVRVAERSFTAARWMVHQADEFRNLAAQLAQEGCVITVAGDGLLPHVAREMARPMHPSAACYDFAHAPASWDFFNWLVIAEMDRTRRGAPAPLRVGFSPGPVGGFRADSLPWTPEQRKQFFERVMIPALPLIGAVHDSGAVHGRTYPYLYRAISNAARAGEAVPRFRADRTTLDYVRGELQWMGFEEPPIVITLREAAHWPQRNSNLDAWFAFARARQAEGCGVLFVRDTEKADEPLPEDLRAWDFPPKDVLVRAALYNRARCNLFVANGPAALTIFGEAPFLMFKPLVDGWCAGTPEWWTNNVGVKPGEQFPWCRDDQRVVWADDTAENIETAWHDFLARERRP